MLRDAVLLEQGRNLRNKLCRESAPFERNQLERARCLGLAVHEHNTAVFAGSVNAQNQHGRIRISAGGLYQLEQNSTGALGMNEHIAVTSRARPDFLGD